MTATALQTNGRVKAATRRLLVTVQDLETKAYRPVGFLRYDGDQYTFAYLRREREREGFRPLPGLARAADGPLRSATLFPLFAERVISSRRPDRELSMDALGLPLDAEPMEVLARSHGQRVGDLIELLPAPEAAAGQVVDFTFLAHGVRYLTKAEQDRICALRAGDQLLLRRDVENPVNRRAYLVTDLEDARLGWLPDPLINVVDSMEDRQLAVERANGPEVGFHFRLLVWFSGTVSRDRPLSTGPQWETV